MKALYTASLAVLLISLFLPLGVFKVLIASALLLFYPGFLIAQYLFKDHSHAFVVSLVVGASFWTGTFYIISPFNLVRIEPAVVVSVVSAVLLDIKGKRPRLQKWMIPLLVCVAFSSLYFYPWNTTLIPPLDDAKIHSLFIVSIENLHQLPYNYGMYTEIPRLTYPLGYHALLAVIKGLSGQSLFPAVTLSTWVLLLCTPCCFYVFSLPYGEKPAVFSAFSFSFLSIFFHRLEQTSTYPYLLALEIFVLSLYALRNVLEDFSFKKAVITSLLMASAVEIHIYAVFLYAPFLAIYGVYILIKKDTIAFKRTALIIFLSGLFLIAYGVQFRLYTPHEEELPYLRDWYYIDSQTNLNKLDAALSCVSPILLLLFVVSLFTLKNTKDAVLLFLVFSMLAVPVLSIFQIEYPGWYALSPNRVLRSLFIPLCIFSGMVIAHLGSAFDEKKILFILVMLSVVLHFTDLYYPWSNVPDVSEINPPDDIDVIFFTKTLPPDSVILNFSVHYDPSGWIPSVAERMIFLPPFLGHRGDGCIHYLKAPERISDLSRYLEHHELYAVEFLRKYSIDYVFVTSYEQHKDNPIIDLESFLNSPLYTLVYRKGDSHFFRVDIPSEGDDREPLITALVLQSWEIQ